MVFIKYIFIFATVLFKFSFLQADIIANVWKSPTCQCCNEWIDYIKKHKFKVYSNNSGNKSIREKYGYDEKLSSCHTAIIQGYIVEGHVPVEDILKLIEIKPKNVLGITVPNMPIGSPGMDHPSYGKKQSFDVLLIKKDGSTTEIFNRY